DLDIDDEASRIDPLARLEMNDLVPLGAPRVGASALAPAFDEDALRAPDERAEVRRLELVPELEEPRQAFALHLFWDVVAVGERRDAGTLGVFEPEEAHEADLAHEREGRLEIVLGLTGESDDDVRGERQARLLRDETGHALDV